MPAIRQVPTTLITGFLGVGKTTAVLDLLQNRPAAERWAVLVNEFGEVGIDGAAIEGSAGGGITIKEVPGGCICCAAQLPMRVAVTRLLREAKPQRLLIEPTGLGHPAGIVDALRDEWLREALVLRATLCIVDPRQFADPDLATSPVYQDQLNLADVLVANKTDLATPGELHSFMADANAMYPPKLLVEQTRWGKLDPEWLDLDPRPGREAAHPDAHDHDYPAHSAAARVPLAPGEGQRVINTGLGSISCGWVFSPETRFDFERLHALFTGLNTPGGLAVDGLQRAKGVFRTGREWQLANWSAGLAEFRPIAYRRDSRVEIIAQSDAAPDWERFEAALRSAIKSS